MQYTVKRQCTIAALLVHWKLMVCRLRPDVYVVLAGPAGSGKTFLLTKLLESGVFNRNEIMLSCPGAAHTWPLQNRGIAVVEFRAETAQLECWFVQRL